MSYPDNCVRGIPNDTFINSDGTIGAHLFYFDKLSDAVPEKKEVSINWEDNDSVVAFTLAQRQDDGTFHFKFGVAVLPREAIESLSILPTIKGLLSYERRKLNGNPFHGNILLDIKASKKTMKQIAAALALHCYKPVLR